MWVVVGVDDRVEWSIGAYAAYNEARRVDAERFQEERDRRYAEVAAARAQALQIKERADETARVLAREIQEYKDEKANELREQINSERGLYATKEDIKPLVAWVASQQGRSSGINSSLGYLIVLVGFALTIVGLLVTR